MAAIDFLHLGAAYSGQTLRCAAMGGTESSVVQLAEALARRGHDVAVFNGVTREALEFGVTWAPISRARGKARGEIGVAVASPKAFQGLDFRNPVFWLHNPTNSWRQIKRGNLPSLLRARPDLIVLGEYHDAKVPRWLPFRRRLVISHGVHPDFFRSSPAVEAPAPRAIFTSQPYRGLDWLLNLWGEIKGRVPSATLHVFAPRAHQAAQNAVRGAPSGVQFRGAVSRPALIGELGQARVQFIPGHRDETYCLAAAEAIAAGVPVVTLGLGALCERVRHGRTGFIARDKDEFVARAVALLSDNALWRSMHEACLSEAALTTWDARAEEWERLVLAPAGDGAR